MASVKVKFRPSTVQGQQGTVYYQIIHRRSTRQFVTAYHVYPAEWDESRDMVRMAVSDERKPVTKSVRDNIRRDVERMHKIVRRLDDDGMDYSCDDVIDAFRDYLSNYSLFNYMRGIIARLKTDGKTRTSETYSAALNSFRSFRNDNDIMLDSLNSADMESFEAWHRKRGNTANTVSFYTRILRAAYNRAVEEGAISDHKPFRHVYTGVDKTTKRAIPIGVMKDIRLLDLSSSPFTAYARDMFLLSFFLRGMSFIDMAFLKKTDLMHGYVVYRRRKTGQLLSIAWTREMQAIIDRYPKNPTQYLLPILTKDGVNERYAYKKIAERINRHLKRVASMVGVNIPLTMYCARHSWASAARDKGVPVSVISEGMGHDCELTTQIYLSSLDTSVVDKANALILQSI